MNWIANSSFVLTNWTKASDAIVNRGAKSLHNQCNVQW